MAAAKKFRVTAPVEGLTQKIIGVNFADSVGETDDEAKVSYFRRHGYKVEAAAEAKAPAKSAGKTDPPAPEQGEQDEQGKA